MKRTRAKVAGYRKTFLTRDFAGFCDFARHFRARVRPYALARTLLDEYVLGGECNETKKLWLILILT